MKYFFILIINILTFNLYAQDMCDVFWDEMRKETNNLSLFSPLDIEIQNYGFDIVNTNHPIDDDLRYIDESRTEFVEEKLSNLKLFNHFYFMDFALATSPIRKDYNLCLDNNCLDNKSISKIINSDEYIVIDYFYDFYADDYFLNNDEIELIDKLKSKVKNYECIQLLSNDAALYFLLRKKSCTKYYFVFVATSNNTQRKLIKELENTQIIIEGGPRDNWDVPLNKKLHLVYDELNNSFYEFKKISRWRVFLRQ